MIILKSVREVKMMRKAGRLVAQAHRLVKANLRPGITTETLDQLVASFIEEHDGQSSFLGYQGFPATTCISVNEEVVHGVPSTRVLKRGDIISIDIGIRLNGYHGDAAWSYCVGESRPEVERLFSTTKQALYAGIQQACVGHYLNEISLGVQRVVDEAGYHIVRDYSGHGIGRNMHEDPPVANYWDEGTSKGPRLRAGMTLAIEPLVIANTNETKLLDDKWTVVSADRSLSAHFEHTIAITPRGPLILTCL